MAKKLTVAQRQNKGVKVGTVKAGAAGKKANRWNGSKWVPVSGSRTGYVTTLGGSKDTGKGAQDRKAAQKATSGTVSSAVSQGRSAGAGSGNGTKAGTISSRGGSSQSAMKARIDASQGQRRAPVPGSSIAANKNRKTRDASAEGTRKAITAVAPLYGPVAVGAGMAAAGAGAAARAAAGRVAAAARARTPAGKAAEAARPARLGPGETRTSPIANPRLDGGKSTGPKTLQQVRSVAAKKGVETRRANAAKKAAATRKTNVTRAKSKMGTK